MNPTSFMMLLIVALFFNSVVSAQTTPRNLKLSETPNKYASPQLYVFGGYDGHQTSPASYLSSASQFNTSTGEWEVTTDMATGRHSSCGAVVGTKIYLFGGIDSGPNLKTAEVYDCETGTYAQFRSMPSVRYRCGAAVLYGYIYVAGGSDSSVIRYNIQTTRRENVSPMHTSRAGLQLVELGGRLYAIGGSGKTVEAYNATTDRWVKVSSTQFEHAYFGAAVHDGKIYVCSDKGFEAYSPDTDEWETLTSLNSNSGRTLVSMNGKLWAIGGGGSKSVHTYNTSTRKWSEQAEMDVVRTYHTAFVVNH